ncbi:hypothetical protein [Endozoicomonas lisbonensis]|uniref:Uncharacterized protein n=1 Tax=Endozoicomonas lisbonensis TaxID=3120522 RepID=A0ABV2SGZ1_9GAMM
MDVEKLVISSDEDAIRLINDLTNGQVDPDFVDVSFDDWPNIHVYLKGEKYNKSMTPSVMAGFIELQKNLNKTFALLKYQDSGKRLTEEEQKQLEISVEVEEGSSDLMAKLAKPLEVVAKGVANGVQNMDSLHMLIAVLGVGVMFAGGLSFKNYLQYRREVRLKELDTQKSVENREIRLAELNQQEFASAQETERLKLLKDVFSSHPALKAAEDFAHDSHTALLKGASNADYARIQGSNLPVAMVDELKRNARKRGIDDRLTSTFRVLAADHSPESEVRLKLQSIEDKDVINASLLLDENLDREKLEFLPKMKELIIRAEWDKSPLTFTLIVRRSGDKITKATVESVQEPAKVA